MFVNSNAGINKLGLMSTALPEVCMDSRGAGREGGLRPQPCAASSASQKSKDFILACSLQRCFGTCPEPSGLAGRVAEGRLSSQAPSAVG